MKKVYIYAVEKKALKIPGPDQYDIPSTIGKAGPAYTMRSIGSRTQSKKICIHFVVNNAVNLTDPLPGPGNYRHLEITGSQTAYKINSKLKTPITNSFSSEPRFKVPSKHFNLTW